MTQCSVLSGNNSLGKMDLSVLLKVGGRERRARFLVRKLLAKIRRILSGGRQRQQGGKGGMQVYGKGGITKMAND